MKTSIMEFSAFNILISHFSIISLWCRNKHELHLCQISKVT